MLLFLTIFAKRLSNLGLDKNQFENILEYSLSSLDKGTSLRAPIVFQSPIVLIDDLIKPRTEIPGIPRIIDLIIYVPRCTVLNCKMNLLKVSIVFVYQ